MPTVLDLFFCGGYVPTALNMIFFFLRRLRADCLELVILRRLRADCLEHVFFFCGGFVPTVLLIRRLFADCLFDTAASCRLSCL